MGFCWKNIIYPSPCIYFAEIGLKVDSYPSEKYQNQLEKFKELHSECIRVDIPPLKKFVLLFGLLFWPCFWPEAHHRIDCTATTAATTVSTNIFIYICFLFRLYKYVCNRISNKIWKSNYLLSVIHLKC